MTAKDLGTFIACAEYSTPAEQVPFIEGMAARMNKSSSSAAGRLLVKAAHACMKAAGMGHTRPASHLYVVARSPEWNTHCQEVALDVSRVLSVLEPMHKQAFSELEEGLGAGLRGVGYASAGAGAGAGALWWLLSRHANQEAAEIEAEKKKVNYYKQLSNELHESMRRKYHYPDLQAGTMPEKAAAVMYAGVPLPVSALYRLFQGEGAPGFGAGLTTDAGRGVGMGLGAGLGGGLAALGASRLQGDNRKLALPLTLAGLLAGGMAGGTAGHLAGRSLGERVFRPHRPYRPPTEGHRASQQLEDAHHRQ